MPDANDTPSSSTPPAAKDRRAELLEARAAREAEREKAAAAAELVELELEDRFERELGPRGSQFEIVDFSDIGEGFVVVKLGESVLMTKFRKKLDSTEGPTNRDLTEFVTPCVAYPAKAAFLEMTERRDMAWWRCANALITLFGLRKKVEAGKF